MNYTFWIIVSVISLIGGGIVAHATAPYHLAATPVSTATMPVGAPPKPTPADPMVTFDGELVCLPPRAGSQQLTLECTIGLRTTEGKHYGLENIDLYFKEGKVGIGQRVKVMGQLRADAEGRYDINGAIYVTSVSKLD
jgi:hypothetical protein